MKTKTPFKIGVSVEKDRSGSLLLAAVPIAILSMSLMVAFVGTRVETKRASNTGSEIFHARVAAQNAVSLAIADLWGDFEAASEGQAHLAAVRKHLDDQNILNQADAEDPLRTSYLDSLNLATTSEGFFQINGVEIEALHVHRLDGVDGTDIVVEVAAVKRDDQGGSSLGRRSSIQEIFTLAPPVANGGPATSTLAQWSPAKRTRDLGVEASPRLARR